MIFDTIINRSTYENISPGIKIALEYLAKTDFSKMADGRHDLDGNNLFALVQRYYSIPKEQGKWEYHRKYIDIQYISEGVEQIGFQNIDKMKDIVEYNPEKDIAFQNGDGNYVTVNKNSFCIFFPHDSHQPKLAVSNAPAKVVKVVMKIKVD